MPSRPILHANEKTLAPVVNQVFVKHDAVATVFKQAVQPPLTTRQRFVGYVQSAKLDNVEGDQRSVGHRDAETAGRRSQIRHRALR